MPTLPQNIFAGEALKIGSPVATTPAAPLLYLGQLEPIPLTADTTISGDKTAQLKVGVNPYEIWVSDEMIERGFITIKPSVKLGQDTRTEAAQILDALKEALVRLASQDEVSISMFGRQATYKDPAAVQELIDKYQAIVDQQNGKNPIFTIPVRFR